MKKLFSILAVLMTVFFLTSCEKKTAEEPDGPDTPSGQTDPSGKTDPSEDPPAADDTSALAITVSKITGSSALVQVVPSTTGSTYYFTITEAANVQGMTDAQMIQNLLIAEMDAIIEYYAAYNPTYADLLSTGSDQYEFTELSANTKYIAAAAYINENGQPIDGKLRKEYFTTTSSSQGGGSSTGTLTLSVKKTSTGISVTPSNNTDSWDYYFMEKSEFTSSWGSDGDAVAEAAYYTYGTEYAAPGACDFLYSEMIEYGMAAGNWVFIAWGCDDYGVTTQAYVVEFTLSSSSSYYAPKRYRIPTRRNTKTFKKQVVR